MPCLLILMRQLRASTTQTTPFPSFPFSVALHLCWFSVSLWWLLCSACSAHTLSNTLLWTLSATTLISAQTLSDLLCSGKPSAALCSACSAQTLSNSLLCLLCSETLSNSLLCSDSQQLSALLCLLCSETLSATTLCSAHSQQLFAPG